MANGAERRQMIVQVRILIAGIITIASAALLYALLTPSQGTDGSDHGGMWGMHDTYSSMNVSIVTISAIVIVSSLLVLILWRRYEPLPPSMSSTGPVARQEPLVAPGGAVTSRQTEATDPGKMAAHNLLVLRLLTGDERTMFKAIMDTGGEALQKDLIQRTRMSNSKVSRVLDRLCEKDVITKERYGATNKVRIRLDR